VFLEYLKLLVYSLIVTYRLLNSIVLFMVSETAIQIHRYGSSGSGRGRAGPRPTSGSPSTRGSSSARPCFALISILSVSYLEGLTILEIDYSSS